MQYIDERYTYSNPRSSSILSCELSIDLTEFLLELYIIY